MSDLNTLQNQALIPQERAQYIRQQFSEFEGVADNWKKKAESLVVTSEDQVGEMQMARAGRLAIGKVRIAIEKTRKKLNENVLEEKRLIDGCAKQLTAMIQPIEDHLKHQETFAERAQAKRIEQMVERRSLALVAEEIIPSYYKLDQMTEEEFAALLDTARAAKADREAKVRANEKLMAQRCEALEAEGVNTRFLNVLTMTEEEFQSRLSTAKSDRERKEQDRVENELHCERAGVVIQAGLGEAVPFLGKMSVDEFEKFVAAEKQKQEAKAEADRKAKEATLEAERLKEERNRMHLEQNRKIADERRKTKEAKAKQQQAEAELLAKKQAEEAEAKRKADESKRLAEAPDREKIYEWIRPIQAAIEAPPRVGQGMERAVEITQVRIRNAIRDLMEEIYVKGD